MRRWRRWGLRASAPLAEPLDLAEVARDIVMDRAPRAAAAECDLALDAVAPAEVLVDRALVETAVSNLVDNAIAHAGPGASILVRVQQSGVIEVVDDGRGIPADRRDRLLQPFARGSAAGQLGLGLALVGDAVAAMGGVSTWPKPRAAATPPASASPTRHDVVRAATGSHKRDLTLGCLAWALLNRSPGHAHPRGQ